jgi:hypothetical protein
MSAMMLRSAMWLKKEDASQYSECLLRCGLEHHVDFAKEASHDALIVRKAQDKLCTAIGHRQAPIVVYDLEH